MKKFLSIDWDYFIDATATERLMLFPDGGNENLPKDLQKYIWSMRYQTEPELSEIGVIEEFSQMKNLLNKALVNILSKYFSKDTTKRTFMADSHRHMYDMVIYNTMPSEVFEVYNIDFHHDLYSYKSGKERVNCGNWGTCLQEDRPNMKFHWVKREDSDTEVIGGFEVECGKNTLDELFDVDFDFIYLCRSSIWSPPHLDHKFLELAESIFIVPQTPYEDGIVNPRTF